MSDSVRPLSSGENGSFVLQSRAGTFLLPCGVSAVCPEAPAECPGGRGPGVTVCLGFHLSFSEPVLTHSILWVNSVGLLQLIFNA